MLNEAKSIRKLYEEIKQLFKSKLINYKYEIIFVNDGSTDETLKILDNLQREDKNIFVIDFKDNLGKTQALKAGFKKSTGRIIVTLDGDLQDDPKNIPTLIDKLNKGYDMVVGWRRKRKDSLIKIYLSLIFNSLLRVFSKIPFHDFNCGLKVMTKDVAKNLALFGDSHRFIALMAAKKKYRVTEVTINHRKRLYGKSKYGFSKIFSSFHDLYRIYNLP